MMSSKAVIITVVVVLVIVLAVWYLSYVFLGQMQQGQQMQTSNAPDSTQNISSDLNKVPSDSTVNGDMNTLDQDLQNF